MRPGVFVLLAALAVLAPSGVSAQLEGAVHLVTGFVPDPANLEGHTRGVRPGTELAPQCVGFFGAQPSHVLSLDTRFGFLRIFATGAGDLALAVHTADGQWLCSEDRFGPHPSVEGLFAQGRVEIYVGIETQALESDYVMRITEMRSVRPGVGAEVAAEEGVALARDLGLAVDAEEGVHEGIRLRRGFLPDPRWIEGAAGGPIDASGLGGTCRGRISAQPTHVVTLLTDFDFLQLYLDVQGEVTLVVLAPSGQFLCDVGNEDTIEVTSDSWPTGVYRVWIGTVQEDATLRHRLGISEIRRVR